MTQYHAGTPFVRRQLWEIEIHVYVTVIILYNKC